MTATCSTPKPYEKKKVRLDKNNGPRLQTPCYCLSKGVVGTVKTDHTAHGPGASYGLKRQVARTIHVKTNPAPGMAHQTTSETEKTTEKHAFDVMLARPSRMSHDVNSSRI